jgi:putative membrane protein
MTAVRLCPPPGSGGRTWEERNNSKKVQRRATLGGYSLPAPTMQTIADCRDQRYPNTLSLTALLEGVSPLPTKLNRCLGLISLMVATVLASAQQGGSMSSSDQPDADARSSSRLSAADLRFIKAAAEGGMEEVELGHLARLKGSSEDVKKFARRMVEDHSKAHDRLKELATAKGIALPRGPNALQEATKDRLMKLSGEQFDKAYMMDMVQDHKKDVAAFRIEKHLGRDPEVKKFASETLPALRDHLKDAQSIEPKVLQARGEIAPSKASQR